jgi:Pyruvate/2-oxoacid:ferredoxin oxidoreductase gamma subunit
MAVVEREIMLTGIGGQGVQLAAQVLARAATIEHRHVMLFGIYAGAMRGMNSDSTVVVGDAPIQAPPIVARTWSAIALHHKYWEPMRARLRPDALLILNTPVFEADVDREACRVLEIDATGIASDLGNPMAASMVITGAYVAATALVTLDGALEGMRESLPPYRRQHVPLNEAALRAGFDAVPELVAPAWDTAVSANVSGAAEVTR